MEKEETLGWIVSAFGITGIVVALGYTVRVAQSDLLGVSTYDSERAGYMLAAGDFIVRSCLLLLDWPTLVTLVVGLLIVMGLEAANRRSISFWQVRSILAIGVVLLCAAQLTFFVLPVTPINNTLFDSICPGRTFDVSALISWRTDEIWKYTLCSRVSKETLPECGTTAPGGYRRKLNTNYMAAILLSALVWMIGWRVLTLGPAQSSDSSRGPEPIPWVLARILLAISLLLIVVGDAYLYGKTVQSTAFPLAQIGLIKGVEVAAATDQDADGKSNAAVKPDASRSKPELYVIASKTDNTIFYDLDNDKVLFIRNSAVNFEKTSSVSDVLLDRIARQKSSCGGQRE